MIKHDEILGTLEYGVNWEKPYTIKIFNNEVEVVLSIEGEEDDEIEAGQKESFLQFYNNIEAVMFDAEYKLFEYYKNNFSIFRERINEELRDTMIPLIRSKDELGNFVKPYMIRFPYTFGKDIKVFGILFDCPWDDEAGVAVKFENDRISVGKDDIIL